MEKINFPKDFKKLPHRLTPRAVQYKPIKEQPVFISIVGGPQGCGLYGDGINFFELMIGDKVEGWLSTDEVNERINKVMKLISE